MSIAFEFLAKTVAAVSKLNPADYLIVVDDGLHWAP
jgi:hypothetical protein